MTTRDLDLVLYGATGFVGKLTAAYLAGNASAGMRIGLAGRSQQRLEEVRSRLGPAAHGWPVIVADSADRSALTALARRTTAVATTVGPYLAYGLPLVAACAQEGTHYADLTGEVPFMRRTIDDLDAVARDSGARIVHTAGFDSVPSDLGVLLLHDAVSSDGAGELGETTLVVTGLRGGLSGGTLASMQNQFEAARQDADVRRLMFDPYGLSPDRDAEPDRTVDGWPPERDAHGPAYDAAVGQWTAPFVMAAVNTRVVRRSNALREWAYGRRFRYREVMGTGAGPFGLAKSTGLTGALAVGVGALSFGPTRSLLSRLLPKPGEGPSERTRSNGYFRIDIHTTTTTGKRYCAHLAARGDPGYAATAVMFAEAGLALALDTQRLPGGGGVRTPATGLGRPLVDRLRAAGHTYEVGPV